MPQMKSVFNQLRSITDAINRISGRVDKLQAQIHNTPVRFTVASAGYMTENAAAGDNHIHISTLPAWISDDLFWIVIDPGNVECEIRKCTSYNIGDTTTTVTFSSGGGVLDYGHTSLDTVIITNDPTILISWFGAKGDDSNDDTLEFQRALAQAGKLASQVADAGAVIYVPPGKYLLTGTLTFPSKVSMRGDGQYKTNLEFRVPGSHCIQSTGADHSNRNYDIEIASLRISQFQSGGVWPINSIQLTYCQAVRIRDCYFNQAGNDAIYADKTNNLIVENCYFYSMDNNAISAIGTLTYFNYHNRIVNNVISEPGEIGVYAEACMGLVVSGNYIDGPGAGSQNGVKLYYVYNSAITGNYISSFGEYGIEASVTYYSTFYGNSTYYNAGGMEITSGEFSYNTVGANQWNEDNKITHGYTASSEFLNLDGLNRWVSAVDFGPYVGSPVLSVYSTSGLRCYNFPDASDKSVRVGLVVPSQLSTGTWRFAIYYTTSDNSGGNVRWGLGMGQVAIGQNVNPGLSVAVTVRAAPSQSMLDYYTVSTYATFTRPRLVVLEVIRYGTHGDDTHTGTVSFFGLRVYRSNH